MLIGIPSVLVKDTKKENYISCIESQLMVLAFKGSVSPYSLRSFIQETKHIIPIYQGNTLKIVIYI